MSEEKQILVRHLRRHHPNLLSGAITGEDWRNAIETDCGLGFSSGPLPWNGLGDVPTAILEAVHSAAHMGLFFPHPYDDLFCRDHEADPHFARSADQREEDNS